MISVLIVDDNEADRYLLKRQLKETGLDLAIVERDSGAAALSFLSDYRAQSGADPTRFPPAVIVLDVNMPLVDGWTFLEEFAQLRNVHDFSGSVVMMYSSSERPEERKRAEAYEFVRGYLVKGAFDSDELRATIETR
ncbi:MAG: response regulator [Myxococcota bacterium]